MADAPLLPIDHPLLEEPSTVVTEFDGQLAELADALFDMMDHEGSTGLCAVQIGMPERLIVVDAENAAGEAYRMVLVNAEITVCSDRLATQDESCLSMPGYLVPVPRYARIEVSFQSLEGDFETLIADGPLAVCLQQEIDLTNGILFVDRVSAQRRRHADDISKKARRRAIIH